jgi:hypothetical protein
MVFNAEGMTANSRGLRQDEFRESCRYPRYAVDQSPSAENEVAVYQTDIAEAEDFYRRFRIHWNSLSDS